MIGCLSPLNGIRVASFLFVPPLSAILRLRIHLIVLFYRPIVYHARFKCIILKFVVFVGTATIFFIFNVLQKFRKYQRV